LIFESVAATAQQTELAATAGRYLKVCREKLTRRKIEEPDPYLLAVVERNRGRLEEAHVICSAGGRRSKDPRFAYLAASLFVEQEEYDEAARFLELAFELDPATRVHAQLDSDFEPMRTRSEYAGLF
jgi:tetratricopeptide (TPR) repeat protein